MSTLEIVLLCLVLAVLGVALAKWLYKKDEQIEDRRRAAARLAATLKSIGLNHTPEFLISYSVGDYSDMGVKLKQLVDLFLDGEEAVLREFGKVFKSCLEAKLKSKDGIAEIEAKLAEAKAVPKA
jgi:hypothetical protein